MLRIISRSLNYHKFTKYGTYGISNWKLPASELDVAGISGFLDCRNNTYLTLSQKLSEISPLSLYTGFDEWTRELLITLSVDLNCGLATSIILATVAIKTIFLFPTLVGQAQGLKNSQLKHDRQQFQTRMKNAQMTGNKHLMAQANYDFKILMKKKGMNMLIPLINLVQIPILVTWFLSLRYLSNLPEIYPQILSEGYLWFTDLSNYDPYGVLPVLAAIVTSLSILKSPNLARNNLSIPFLAQYIKYIPFAPFLSLPFTAFFPASINLYWLTLSCYQLFITQLFYIPYVRRKLGLSDNDKYRIKQIKQTKYDEAVFIEQKKSSEEIISEAGEQQIQQPIKKFKQNIQINQEIKSGEVKQLSLKRISKKKKV